MRLYHLFKQHPFCLFTLVLLLTAASAATLSAQELALATEPTAPAFSSSVAPDLPSEPIAQAPAAQTPTTEASASQAVDPNEHVDTQTSRILGIIPNFRAVSANQTLPPQSVKEKFTTASEDSFDYSSIVLPATVAFYNYERNSTPEFGSGGVGYGRYLWHSVVDQTIENYMVEFIVPAITHEDTRYYTLGQGGFLKRTGYSLSRAFVTRSDNAKPTFNAGEIIGAGAAAGLSNLYYPSAERTLSNTGTQWGLDVGIDSLTFMVKEFWPDINHALFHGTKIFHLPHPNHHG